MKKIKLITSRCTKKSCGYYVITDYLKKECPLCKSKMVRDRKHTATGYDSVEPDDAFIGFMKNVYNKKSNNTKAKK